MTSIKYEASTFSALRREAEGLLMRQYKEMAETNISGASSFEPDYDFYQEVEKRGGMSVIVARHKGGIIAYLTLFVAPHPHYLGHLVAVTDLLYVDKNYRRKGVLKGLIVLAEALLKEREVSALIVNEKTTHLTGGAFERMGFSQIEVSHYKDIRN